MTREDLLSEALSAFDMLSEKTVVEGPWKRPAKGKGGAGAPNRVAITKTPREGLKTGCWGR